MRLKELIYIILSILFVICQVLATNDTKLLLVQILWRHGDRAPITLYPNDPNSETFWTEGLGKLTMLGRKQHYAFGKYLRLIYDNFTSSSPNEINVISSESDRCRKSAATNLASFFAPSLSWKFNKDLNWQPISISYIPKIEDKFLETDSDCPQAELEQKRVVNSPEGQEFITSHKKMFDYLTIHSGKQITNWSSASYLYDTIFIEKKYNLTVPSWVERYWDELKNVSDLSFYWSFNSPLLHRLRAGPLLGRIIELMQNKLAGDIPMQKFQIYSAHDTNIAVILDALNLYPMKAPPYCAALVFELHERTDGTKVVRLIYFNSTSPETEFQDPNILILNECTEFCPLNYFINLTKDLIPNDWNHECQLDETFIEKLSEKYAVIGLSIMIVTILILAISVYFLWRLYFRNRNNYSYHLMQMS